MQEYNLKAFKKTFKENGIFYTDLALAKKLKELVPKDVKEVYDPTCGRGNLLSVFDDNVKKYGQELNESELKCAQDMLVNFTGHAGDTLKDDKFKGVKFDCIVANPPFSIKWESFEDERFSNAPCLAPPSRADYAFILHIIHHLKDEGIAVCLCFPGILYRGKKEGEIRRYLIEGGFIKQIIAVPPNSFTDTSIATVILVLKKNRQGRDILFKDMATGNQQQVSFDEIKNNDFMLSVNSYMIEDITPKEPIDPFVIEERCRGMFLAKLRAELTTSKMIYETFKDTAPFYKFVEDIKRVLREFSGTSSKTPQKTLF